MYSIGTTTGIIGILGGIIFGGATGGCLDEEEKAGSFIIGSLGGAIIGALPGYIICYFAKSKIKNVANAYNQSNYVGYESLQKNGHEWDFAITPTGIRFTF